VRGTAHSVLWCVSLLLFILLVRIHTTGSLPPGCVGGVYACIARLTWGVGCVPRCINVGINEFNVVWWAETVKVINQLRGTPVKWVAKTHVASKHEVQYEHWSKIKPWSVNYPLKWLASMKCRDSIEVLNVHEVLGLHRSACSSWSGWVTLKYHTCMKCVTLIEVPTSHEVMISHRSGDLAWSEQLPSKWETCMKCAHSIEVRYEHEVVWRHWSGSSSWSGLGVLK